MTTIRNESRAIRPLLINIRYLAELLSRSPRALLRDEREGRIPHSIRLGRTRYWILAEIKEWIDSGCARGSVAALARLAESAELRDDEEREAERAYRRKYWD